MAVVLDGTNFLAIDDPVVKYYPLSVAGWVKVPETAPGGNSHYYFTQGGETSTRNRTFSLTPNVSASWFQGRIWIRAVVTSHDSINTSSVNIQPADRWCHIAGTVLASNETMTAYAEGGYKASKTPSFIRQPGANIVCAGIGGLIWRNSGVLTGTGLFAARFAHVAVWNTILTDEEVATLASGADPSTVQSETLAAYWPLLENGNDVSGNDFHLTGYNEPTFDANDSPEITGGTEDASATIAGVGSITGTVRVLTGEEVSATIAGVSTITATASGTQTSTTVKDSDLKILTRLIAINNDCLYYEDV